MSVEHPLIPDFDWLATSRDADESWLGPGPMLVNLEAWMELLATAGHHNLVAATYAAAETARPHWENWLNKSREIALESLLDSQSPTEQLAAVARWLVSPKFGHRTKALNTVDLTKQMHWFHEEYSDVWFNEPGMWAVESSEYCVLSLTGDPYSQDSLTTLAAISVSCAVNSFRLSPEDDIRKSLSIVVDAVRHQLAQMG